MDSVWFVEQGEYSDYRVVGVYTSEENAEKIKNAINATGRDDEADVVMRRLDEYIDPFNRGFNAYHVQMARDGTTVECINRGWQVIGAYDIPVLLGSFNSSLRRVGTYILSGCVYARDETHAIKIVNEKRAQLIAMGEWPEEG